ncbi:MAG: hypothetical protein FOGNACKC_02727 [Anaerolineae bacterium]|nr:hypothetical protein [Anaerolineae bacterium]
MESSTRQKIGSLISLFALILNLIPFHALPARAAELDLGTPAENAHHRPRPVMIFKPDTLTSVGRNAAEILPTWFTPPAISKVDYSQTAGLTLSTPPVLANMPPAAEARPQTTILPNWFATPGQKPKAHIVNPLPAWFELPGPQPQAKIVNPLPSWFAVPQPAASETPIVIDQLNVAAGPAMPADFAPNDASQTPTVIDQLNVAAGPAMPADFMPNDASQTPTVIDQHNVAAGPAMPADFTSNNAVAAASDSENSKFNIVNPLPAWFASPANPTPPVQPLIAADNTSVLPGWFNLPPAAPVQPFAEPQAGSLAQINGLVVTPQAPPNVSAGDEAVGGNFYTVTIRNGGTATGFDFYVVASILRDSGGLQPGVGFTYVLGTVQMVSSISGTIPVNAVYVDSQKALTVTPTISFNLRPGEIVTVTLKWQTDGTALSGQRFDVDAVYNNSGVSTTNAGANITVGRGNLIINKTPVIQSGTFGDQIGWNIEVGNTGLGEVYSATVYDVPGSGYTNLVSTLPTTIPVLAIGERRNYALTGTINSCTNLNNSAFAYWTIGNDEGNGTLANPVRSDADVIYNLLSPQVTVQNNNVTFGYCSQAPQTVVVTLTNASGAGAATNFRLISNQSFSSLNLNVVDTSPGWFFDGNRTFTSTNALLGGQTAVFTFTVQPQATVCGSETAGSFLLDTRFTGACSFPYNGPDALINYSYGTANDPSLTVSKNGTIAPDNRSVQFVVNFNAQNIEEISGPIVLTDDISTGFTIVNTSATVITGATLQQVGNRLIWTIPTGGSGNLSGQLTVDAQVITSALDQCAILYSNVVTATADVVCTLCNNRLQDTATVNLSPQIRRPLLQADINAIQFDYCAATPQQMVITVTNAATAGAAYSPTVQLLPISTYSTPSEQPYPGSVGDNPPLPNPQVSAGSVSAGWTYLAGSNSFLYTGNGGVLDPGQTITLAFNIDPPEICGNYYEWVPEFTITSQDACGLPAPPLDLVANPVTYDEQNVPRLGIEKTTAVTTPVSGVPFSYTVRFTARNAQNMSDTIRVRDDVPFAFTILTVTGRVTYRPGNVLYALTGTNTTPAGLVPTSTIVTDSVTNRLTWDVPVVIITPTEAFTLEGELIYYVMPDPNIATECGASTNYNNAATGTAGDRCPTCPGIGPVNSIAPIQIEPGKIDANVQPKSATTNGEVCGLLQVTNVYSDIFVTNWQQVFFTETLGIGSGLNPGDLSYVAPTLAVFIDNTDVTTAVTIVQSAPQLVLEFDNIPGTGIVTGSHNFSIAYSLYVSDTLLVGAPERTISTTSQFQVRNIETVGICGTGDDYLFEQVATTTVRRADLQIDISPSSFVGCADVPVTLTVSDDQLLNYGLDATNVVVTFSVPSPDFGSISTDTNDYSYGGAFAGNVPTVTFGANVITWTFPNPFTSATVTSGTLTGTITFSMTRSCSAPQIEAGVQFDSQCGVTYNDSAFNNNVVQVPDVFLFVTPGDGFPLTQRRANWRIYAFNGGDGIAGRTLITDVMGVGLRFVTYTTNITSQVNLLTPGPYTAGQTIVWEVLNLQPQQQLELNVDAVDAVACIGLDTTIYLDNSCLGDYSCGNVQSDTIRFSRPITGVRSSNAQTADIGFCDVGEVVLTVKNASAQAHIYNVIITETLTTLSYVPGSARITVTDRNNTPYPGLINIPLEPITQAGFSLTGTALMTMEWAISGSTDITTARLLLEDRAAEDTFSIRFLVESDCASPLLNLVQATAGGEEPCGTFFFRDETAVTLDTIEPAITMTKVGRNVTKNTTFSSTVFGEPGDVVVWRIAVSNAATAFDAKNLQVVDSLPLNMNVFTPTASSADGGIITTTPGTVVWDLGDLPADGVDRVLLITATVNLTDINACLLQTENQAVATYGCDAGCRANPITATAELRSQPVITVQLPLLTQLNVCGDPITITLFNPYLPVYSLTLTDTLPAGFAFDGLITVTHNLTSGDYSPDGIVTANGGATAIFTWTTLPVGIFTLTFRTAPSVTAGTCYVNFGNQNQVDLDYDDNPVCSPTGPYTSTAIGAANVLTPGIVIGKIPLNQNVQRGDIITWTVRVTNTGLGEARNLVVTDTLSPGFAGAFTAGNGSFGETPVTSSQQAVWTLTQPLPSGSVWQAVLTATVPGSGGSLNNNVQVIGNCDTGCEHTNASTLAYASLAEFIKGPQIQTGTIGDLAVFTFTGFIDGIDFDYDGVAITDALPTGLGFVAATLAYTTDADASDAGPNPFPGIAPSQSPANGQSGNVIWQLGSVSGTVEIAGVITTVIQNINTNIQGVSRTNNILLTYRESGSNFTFSFTDTAQVDIIEPLLHIGKTYVTSAGCNALLFADNFNSGASPSWQGIVASFSVNNGLMEPDTPFVNMNHGGPTNLSDYSYSMIARANTGGVLRLGMVFRYRDNSNFNYFAWENGGFINVFSRVGGSDTGFAATTYGTGPVVGRWYHFELKVEGSLLRLYIDNQLVLQATDPQGALAGGIGLVALGSASFDDVLVTRLGTSGCFVGAGDLVTYTLTISNQGASAGHDLVITDDIPAGMQLVSYQVVSNGGSSNITGPAVGARNLLTWTVGYLTPTVPYNPLAHTSINIEVVLQVDDTISANTTLSNQASLIYDGQPITGPVGIQRSYSGGSHSTAIRTVDGTITKTRLYDPPPTATLGTLVTYTLIVPSVPITAALYNVVITDQLNSPLFYIEDVTLGGVYTNGVPTFNRATGRITATFDAIPANAQAFVTITTRISHEFPLPATDPNSGDVITNSATFTHATANNTTLTRTNVVTTNVGEPRVSVTKVVTSSTGSLTNLDGNAIVTYTLRLVNNGNSPAYSVHITDSIPAGISVTQVLPGYPNSGPVLAPNVLTWTVDVISNVAPANVVTLTYVAALSEALSNSALTNTVDVRSHSLTETIPGVRPYLTDTTAVITTGLLSLVKATDPITLKVGDVVTYSLVFSVPAGLVGMGGNSYLLDVLPAGLRFIPGSESLASSPAGVITTAQQTGFIGSSQAITWTFGQPITSPQSQPTFITVTFQAQATGAGNTWLPDQTLIYTITNVATLTQRSTFINDDSVNNRVIQPELTILKESIPASGETVIGGQLITYTLRITNNGYAPAYDVVVTDTLPVGVIYQQTISNPTGATVITTTQSGQLLTYDISEIEAGPGATLLITIEVQVESLITANVVLTNNARIPTYDSQPGSGPQTGLAPTQRVYTDGQSSVFHVTAQAGIVKAVTPPTATLGSVITYVLLVPEPPITATMFNVTVSDTLDSRLDLQQVIADGGGAVITAGNTLTVTYAQIDANQQRRITVTAILSDNLGALDPQVITNVAVLSHATSVTVSNQPVFTVTEPNVLITKTGAALSGSPNTTLYTLTLVNNGTSPAYDLNIVDTLPAGIVASGISNGGVLINNGAAISWTITFLDVGQQLQLTYNGALTEPIYASDLFTNTAVVTNTSLTSTIPGVRTYTDTSQAVVRWPLGRLGDYVWLDADYDGQQGTSGAEQPFSGVVVNLYNTVSGTLIATTTTDSNGRYFFEYLPLDISYTVQLAPENFTTGVLSPYLQTRLTVGNPISDSNASITATYLANGYAITTTLTPAFTEDLTLDYGFVPRMALGNQVWFDTNNNGVFNVGTEPPISNVVVELYEDTDGSGDYTPGVDQFISTTTTLAGGFYTFTNLFPGSYLVVITDTNFAPGGALDGYITSTTAVSGNSDLNNNNHGVATGALGAGGYVASTVVDLVALTEPDDGGNANYTIDFGFVRYDFGDLPDTGLVQQTGYATFTYPTQLGDDGARHVILPNNNPTLGSRVDAEVNGQPNVPATGDDIANSGNVYPDGAGPADDEDGVILPPVLIPGEQMVITVTALSLANGGADGQLTGWIDFNGDGQLSVGERIVLGQLITAGATVVIPFTVPLNATGGITTYARFRFSAVSETVTAPTGVALSGEVEDYAVPVVPLDWGDLPDTTLLQQTGYASFTYPTGATDNGPRHIILPANNPTLGGIVDAETNGQPSVNADGDDTANSTLVFPTGSTPADDEDGVQFSGPLVPGETLVLTVSASAAASGYLNAWIDFNGNGVFDAGEQVALNSLITAGTFITIPVSVPVTATQGITTFARFRFSSQQDLQPTGLANDGEIEDYAVPVVALDYGDLPDSSTGNTYPTRNTDNGARHIIVVGNNPTLGDRVDAETDGQPSTQANGDDTATSPILVYGLPGADDEDGITFDTLLIPGQPATITVRTLSAANGGADGALNAWIDFNGNGALDANEQIVTNTALAAGSTVQVSFVVPSSTVTGSVYSRFRLSSDTAGSSSPTGLASDGEVEDYVVRISEVDLGDLPESRGYPTLLAGSGAAHLIDGTYLGAGVDAELDGQPSDGANGDDNTATDDEDGVVFLTPFIAGREAQIRVTAGTTGYLNSWFDFDGDGALDVYTITNVTGPAAVTPGQSNSDIFFSATGDYTLTLQVPNVTISSSLYSRFRYTTNPGEANTPTGVANSGEVEDYVLMSLGDFVWRDDGSGGGTPDDGIWQTTEPVISNVVLVLLNSSGITVTDGAGNAVTTTTDANGRYLFTGLTPGDYSVLVAPGNFQSGGPLLGLSSSTGAGAPNDDFNETADENGIDNAAPEVNGIRSGNITLVIGTEPITDTPSGSGGDANSNLTLDFGFLPLDWGDLPDTSLSNTYPTTLADNGPRHVIQAINNPTLGSQIDAETDGQPSTGADGDDTANLDDEDGVVWSSLLRGQTSTFTVTTSGSTGFLNGWIDWNGDGDFDDAGEQVFTGQNLALGSNSLNVSVPATATITGSIYMRFRYSTSDTLSYTGFAPDGEVEDYITRIVVYDLGDLPETRGYPTLLASSGAAHIIDGTYLGAGVDAELDGQPTDGANGDDNTATDDEDGVVFLTPFIAGREAQIRVTAGTTGYLNSWFDFDGDGALDVYTITNVTGPAAVTPGQSNSDIFFSATGDYTITLQVPNVTISSSLYSRFRYTANPGEANTPTGVANSGEVEDYVLMSLGDFVWRDDGSGTAYNNGRYEPLAGETPISNVVLVLLNSSGITITDGAGNAVTTTTDANGRYLFTGLTPGDYSVLVAPGNFQPGGSLAGLSSSTGAGAPNDDFNETADENGIDNAAPEVNGIRSGNITLAIGTEPITDTPSGSGGDANSNLTLDFGFTPLLSLGNFVWFDGNDNGTFDTGEPGIPGVDVELYIDTNGDGVYTPGVDQFISGTTTLPGGIYTFTNLPPAGYVVVITSTNFTGTGALVDYITSTTAIPSDRNPGSDNTNHGYLNGTFGSGGFVGSTVITLTPGLEPNDAGRANYTIDFSFIRADLGDLPDSYGTTLAANGPYHVILPTNNPTLGADVDAETDGRPTTDATGDDVTNRDDEDGVRLDSRIVSGRVATFTVTGTNVAGAVLNAWIDWNGNGVFDAGEQVFTNTTLVAGPNVLTVSVPGIVLSSTINTRWRYSTDAAGSSTPTGRASDGEVEDHQYAPTVYDWGDLPDSYGTTLAANGPRHVVLPANNPTLGSDVDTEDDGLPTGNATGDDTDNRDDEDGVRLNSPLIPGAVATFTVTGTNVTGAVLNAWIDWNNNGTFDAGERVFTNTTLLAGPNTLTVTVPNIPLSSTVNTRWRYSTDTVGSSSPTGEATNGEVEDHQYPVPPLDMGDLPQGLYPTTLAANGARHVIISGTNPTLGQGVDSETDGQPSVNADGDDLNPTTWYGATPAGTDDEDGVVWSSLVAGQPASVTVSALPAADGGADGLLNAWIDFNGNGVLDDAGEQIASNVSIAAGGSTVINFTVPVSVASQLYSRFRFSSAGNDAPTGIALDGEVEDYVRPAQTADWGDLPAGYGTLLANNGPRHIIDGTFLGSIVDAEGNGVPSGGANGDDLNNTLDDEDGVVFLTPFVAGQPALIRVTAGTTGYLNSWFDFDGDGTLDTFTITDINGTPVSQLSNTDIFFNAAGDYTITLQVPNVTISSSLYSRFRYTTNPNEANTPIGLAPSGEVEDYVLLSLGNLVWRDDGSGGGTPNNGIIDGGEQGIPNVVLELRDGAGNPVTDGAGNPVTTTTDANGRYLFPGLPPGDYTVFIPPSQFGPGGPLANHLSSSPNVVNPNNNVDENGDENGLNSNTPDTSGITSGIITLTPGQEPSGNGNSNLTLDFGFVPLVPGITVFKDVTASPNVISATVTYTLRITNSGQITYTSLLVTDTLPAGITYAGNPSQSPATVNGQQIVWLIPGPVVPSQSLTITFEANVQTGSPGTFINVVTGTGFFTNGSVTDDDDVPLIVTDPALQVIKSLVSTSTGLVTFNIRVINLGPSRLDTVPLFDQFTGPVAYLSSNPPADAFTNPTTSTNSGLIIWTDLTNLNTPPFNAPHNLEPGEHFDVTSVFSITTRDTTFAMVNTAIVSGALDRFTNRANDGSDVETVVGPTAVNLLYFEGAGQTDGVRLRWATAVEIDNYGFMLRRSKTGNYEDAVDVTFVPAEGKNSGATYEYLDRDVTLGETYTYWLIDVDTQGLETRHGPVQITFDGSTNSASTIIYLPLIFRQQN